MNRGLVVLALLLATSPPAHANMGPRTFGGERAGEPAGIVDVWITREELVIDLRPVAARERARVAATYHLDNRGDTKRLDLVFAAGTDRLAELRVTLDGQEVATKLASGAPLPDSWRAPSETPLPDGGSLGFSLREAEMTASFALDVPRGAHVLAIAYAARTQTHHADQPMLLHQFAYVLSPARAWAGFGGLDITVQVPSGWTAAITPAMARTGDTYKASVTGVPADAIALTLHAPPGAYSVVRVAMWIVLAIVTIGGGVLVDRLAHRRERRRAKDGLLPRPGLAAVGLGVMWATVFLVAGLLAAFAPEVTLPTNQVDHREYASAMTAILVVLACPIVAIVGIMLGVRGGRRAHPGPEVP